MFAYLFAFSLSDSEWNYEVSNTREPIRIHFDTKNILYFNSENSQDAEDDSEEIVELVEPYLKNVTQFVEKVIKVNRLTTKMIVNQQAGYPAPSMQECDCDLYIQVFVKKSAPGSNAATKSFQNTLNDKRTLHAAITINEDFINNNETETEPEQITNCLLHEIIHALGVQYSMIQNWINPETKKNYEKPVSTFAHPNYPNKQITMLQTPNAKRFAQNRFGTKYFITEDAEHELGIELEDYNTTGTYRDHPEARVYFDDIMVGSQSFGSKFSDVTIALLKDTGYYDVNESYAEPLAWGDSNALGEKIQNFATGPATTVFPKHYLCDQQDIKYHIEAKKTTTQLDYLVCSHDFSSQAVCENPVEYDCDSNDEKPGKEAYCKAKDFFNPNNYTYVGENAVFDFMSARRKYSYNTCGANSKCVMTYDPDFLNGTFTGQCQQTKCAKDKKSYNVIIDGVEGTCKALGEIVTIGQTKIKCENPLYYCTIDEYFTNFKSFFAESQSNDDDDGLSGGLIAVIVIASVSLVGGSTTVVVIKVKKDKKTDEDPDESVERKQDVKPLI